MVRTTEYFEAQPTHEPVKELDVQDTKETLAPIKKAQEETIVLSGKVVEVEIEGKKKDDDVLEQCFDD
jgi:hypothetical protein